jgi:hypothetical protein
VTGDDATAGLRAARGRVEPPAAEIQAPFAVTLQLLAGTLLVDDAIPRSLIVTTGDAAFIARLAPYLPETATVNRGIADPSSAP